MAEFSAIEWCDATWNPWYGCTRVSPGCANCYMERWSKRTGRDPWKVQRSQTTFRDPLRWKGNKKIFVCSLSDFFHEDVPQEWRRDAWEIMYHARNNHIFMLLTKRPENIKDMLPAGWIEGMHLYWPHIWFGVSVESQKYIDRTTYFYDIPALVKFVSAEPLLGPLDFSEHMGFVDWVIVGGESGANARYMSPAWARIIKYQCQDHGIPFFMKQMTKKALIPDDLMIREFPDD